MARIILFIVFLLVGYTAFLLYSNAKNEQLVYDFCNRWSPTNPVGQVLENVNPVFKVTNDENQGMLTITRSGALPLQSKYSCQIEYSNQRVVSLTVIKE